MADTTQYKLQYFNVQVKGELARYIFKYANVEFEDDRSPSNGNWAKMKPSKLLVRLFTIINFYDECNNIILFYFSFAREELTTTKNNYTCHAAWQV